MTIDQGNATVWAAIIAGGVSVAVSAVITPFVNSWLEKKRVELNETDTNTQQDEN